MCFDEESQKESSDSTEVLNVKDNEDNGNEPNKEKLTRNMSEDSVLTIDEEEDDDGDIKIDVGPQYSLKDQLEKDKVFSSFPLVQKYILHGNFVVCVVFDAFFLVGFMGLGWWKFEEMEGTASW